VDEQISETKEQEFIAEDRWNTLEQQKEKSVTSKDKL
jgi:hypothetical protein